MIKASMNLWESLKSGVHEIAQLVLLNLLWLVCSLAVVTLPASTTALAYAVRQLIYEPTDYKLKGFFEGFKTGFWWSWRWFLPNLVLTLLFLFNILFFRIDNNTITIFIIAGNIVLVSCLDNAADILFCRLCLLRKNLPFAWRFVIRW